MASPDQLCQYLSERVQQDGSQGRDRDDEAGNEPLSPADDAAERCPDCFCAPCVTYCNVLILANES